MFLASPLLAAASSWTPALVPLWCTLVAVVCTALLSVFIWTRQAPTQDTKLSKDACATVYSPVQADGSSLRRPGCVAESVPEGWAFRRMLPACHRCKLWYMHMQLFTFLPCTYFVCSTFHEHVPSMLLKLCKLPESQRGCALFRWTRSASTGVLQHLVHPLKVHCPLAHRGGPHEPTTAPVTPFLGSTSAVLTCLVHLPVPN